MTLALPPIGVVRTPYGETRHIPKGPGARHDAEGPLEIAPEFEAGLPDIKPYLSSVPAGTLKRGWLDDAEARRPAKAEQACLVTNSLKGGAHLEAEVHPRNRREVT